jgi:malate dehydrogenase
VRVGVIGAGAVGATVAQRIVEADLAHVVLVDVVPGLAEGKALDMMHAAPLLGFRHRIEGTTDLGACAGCELLILACGLPRQPGMSREELLEQNGRIVREVVRKVSPHCPEAKILVVTNPLDVMSWLAAETSGFPRHRVLGMAGVLDGARLRYWLAELLGVLPSEVHTLVLGSHGDQMLPLLRHTYVGGIPVETMVTPAQWEELVKKTRQAGARIVQLLQKGSAYYAPSASVALMVRAILRDEKRPLVASVWCDGPYGIRGAYLGLPVILGKEGVEGILEARLSPEEEAFLRKTAQEVRDLYGCLRQGTQET